LARDRAVGVEFGQPVFLNNVTPASGALTGTDRFAKISGPAAWKTAAANLFETRTGGFRMRIAFLAGATTNYVRAGAQVASVGPAFVTGQNDVILGLLQNRGNQIYIINDGALFAGPFPYVAGQECELTYNQREGTVTLTINGSRVHQGPAPANVNADLEHRFAATLFDVGAGFRLVAYEPV
jgi:hypothetical protein